MAVCDVAFLVLSLSFLEHPFFQSICLCFCFVCLFFVLPFFSQSHLKRTCIYLTSLPPQLLGHYTFNSDTMECDMSNKNRKSRFIMIIIEAVVPVLTIIVLYIFVFVMVSGGRGKGKNKGCVYFLSVCVFSFVLYLYIG